MNRKLSTVLAALVVAAAAPPIAAAQTADADLARMAAADLLEEIALLEEVGAFADHPVATAIHAWVDDRFVDRREALEVLVEVDTDNARNLRADIADGWDPGPVARSVLGALPQTDLDRIRNGERGFLAPGALARRSDRSARPRGRTRSAAPR